MTLKKKKRISRGGCFISECVDFRKSGRTLKITRPYRAVQFEVYLVLAGTIGLLIMQKIASPKQMQQNLQNQVQSKCLGGHSPFNIKKSSVQQNTVESFPPLKLKATSSNLSGKTFQCLQM